MNGSEHNLLIELFAIFVWAKVFGEVFEYLRLPAVLGEILAGVVLGPHAIGLVIPSAFSNSLAELGAVFLLFHVGLETRPEDLLRVGRQALGVALGGVLVPFVAGFAYIVLVWRSPQEATFLAAAMVATSVGITARVLGDLNLLNSRPARIILGAAVFDDILGMLVLAVVVGLAASGTIQWLNLTVLVLEAAAFALFMIFVAPKLIGRIRPQLAGISLQNAPLLLAFAICLGLSAAAEQIGMAAIIGAFFAGLAFAEYAPEWNLKPRVSGATEFVAPFFFFAIGSRFDLSIFTPGLLITASVVTVLAILSKLIGCGLPVLREGWPTALQVGVGMVPRGEVGLIVALLGSDMRLISSQAYAVVVFMTAATTLLAPPLLRRLFQRSLPEGAVVT
ncbi:MAG: cation:proton antiporter, partial [Acidobacteriales bacterium]|nr:cation:proton antiporter [Terriglobales bacterium]